MTIYSFDNYGWLSDSIIHGRTTSIQPPTHGAKTVGQPYPNFTGIEWVLVNYTEPVPYVAPVVEEPTKWFIDIGPFFDRFGSSKLAVLMSSEPLVKALIADINVRKWVDLKRADVAQALAALVSYSLLTTEQVNTILNTEVQPEENLVLRKMYFS
jgi:hypothetical protein